MLFQLEHREAGKADFTSLRDIFFIRMREARPDNSAKDNSVKDNSANKSDRRSRANVLRACQQRVGLYTKFRAGYRGDARVARLPATINREITPIPIFFLSNLAFCNP